MAPARPGPVAVLGAGSWGTALAVQIARASHPVLLWGRDPAQQQRLGRERRNERYLPEAAFPPSLEVGLALSEVLAACSDVLLAVPSQALRETLGAMQAYLPAHSRIAWATKGFEQGSGLLPHQVVRELYGDRPSAVLSGPTFAREVGAGLPTAMSIASADGAFARDLATQLAGPQFRVYTQPDIVGVEVGGAVKNVIAIGCGIADGMGFGANTRVALITRGLAEMMRLGVALGAQRETLMGLAGLGDLVLTCTDDQSRNRRLGLAIGRGESPEAARRHISQVVEGVHAASAVREVAEHRGVEMPICREVYAVLHEGKPVADAVRALMGRELRSEAEH